MKPRSFCKLKIVDFNSFGLEREKISSKALLQKSTFLSIVNIYIPYGRTFNIFFHEVCSFSAFYAWINAFREIKIK